MAVLISGAIVFFLLHRIVSAGRLRGPLVARTGEPLFLRLFGIASLVCLVWLTLGYWLAAGGGEPGRWTARPPTWATWTLQFASSLLITSGALVRNPGTAGMTETVSDPDIVRSMLRVTRHPFLWGVGLMSISHILARPDDPTILYFGTLATLALTGTISIDRKRQKRLGEAWTKFAAATSNVPFAAIVRGRQTLRLREIGFRPVGISVGLFVAVMALHWLLGNLIT